MAGGNKSWTWTTRANCFISYYACLAHIAETRQSLDQMTQPLSFHTQHAMLVPLRGWFRWMTRKNHVLHNPASELELPRLGHHLPKHVLNVDEVEQVLRQPNLSDPMGVRDRAILETLYSAGMRRGECVQLNIRQLKLVHGHTHPAEQQPDSAAAKEGDARARAELLGRRSMLKGRKMSSDIIPFMAKHVVHISEAEAASNFVGVLARCVPESKSSSAMRCGLWRWFVPLNRMSACFLNLFVSPKNMLLRLRWTRTSPAILKRRSTATANR
jgi:hypothetical protein